MKVLRVETSSATGSINCKHFSKLGGFVGKFKPYTCGQILHRMVTQMDGRTPQWYFAAAMPLGDVSHCDSAYYECHKTQKLIGL